MDFKNFFRDLRGEGLEKLMHATSIYHATVGPGDCLFIPAHSLVLEHVMREDVLGLKMAVIVSKDTVGSDAFRKVAAASSTPADAISKAIKLATTKTTSKNKNIINNNKT